MADLLANLQTLQEQINRAVEELAREQPEPEVANAVTNNGFRTLEDKFSRRLYASEQHIIAQTEEQTLAMGMVVCVFVLCSFYVFYFLLDNLTNIRRCRCPTTGWDQVVQAAEYTNRVAATAAATVAAQTVVVS